MGILLYICGLSALVGLLTSFVFGILLLIRILTKSGDGKDLISKILGGITVFIVGLVGVGLIISGTIGELFFSSLFNLGRHGH